jgi:hypothetical protein
MLLTGCLSPGEARLPGGTYRLRPPAEAPNGEEWQEVTAIDPNGARKFIVHLLNRPDMTRLTILEPSTMVTLLRSSFDGHEVASDGPMTRSKIPAELPLALLQLSSWPGEAVDKGLTGALQMTVTGRKRTLRAGGNVVLEAEGLDDGLRVIRLPNQGVRIEIRTVQQP